MRVHHERARLGGIDPEAWAVSTCLASAAAQARNPEEARMRRGFHLLRRRRLANARQGSADELLRHTCLQRKKAQRGSRAAAFLRRARVDLADSKKLGLCARPASFCIAAEWTLSCESSARR